MSQLNPLSGSILGSVQAQRQMAVDKERQLRRARALEKNIAARDDELEHQVESSEEVQGVRDEAEEQRDERKRKPPQKQDDEKPRLDLTA
ncbi:MAG: hypothetical protein JWO87_2963 [Phycisphaerales bacterium]|nr:hypothetical protein [Phycisphaerales bacterium]MDB5305023.1 hypothetical protein [Phycisphaerales bacterium]